MCKDIVVTIPVKGILSRSSEEMFRFVITFSPVIVNTFKTSYNTLDDFLNECSAYKIEIVPKSITIKPKYLKKWNTGIRNDVNHFCKIFDKIWKEAAKVTYEDAAMCSISAGVYMQIFSDVNAILKERARETFMLTNTNYIGSPSSDTRVGVRQEFYSIYGRFKLSFWKSLNDDMYYYDLYAYGNSSQDDLFMYYRRGEKAACKDDLKFNIISLLEEIGLNSNQINQVLDYTFRKFNEHLERQNLDIRFENLRGDSIIVGVYKWKKYLKTVWNVKGFGIVDDNYYFEANYGFDDMQKTYRYWLSLEECEKVFKKLTEWSLIKVDSQNVEKRKKGFEKYEDEGEKIESDEDKWKYWRKIAKKYYNLYLEELGYVD